MIARASLLTWDAAEGFHTLTSGITNPPNARDPLTAIEQIEAFAGQNSVFVLKDFHEAWSNPQVKRKLRSACQRLPRGNKSIIITSPVTLKVPDELRDETVLLELPLPQFEEMDEVLVSQIRKPGVKVSLTPLGREKMVQAALGLTVAQAQRVFAKAIVSDGIIDDRDIDLVTEEKKQIIRESEALEFYAASENPR